MPTALKLGNVSIGLIQDAEAFRGIGAFYIDGTQVRSPRVPLSPATQTFTGYEMQPLRLREVKEEPDCLRICLDADFSRPAVKLIRDHSFDPIHDANDWNDTSADGPTRIDLVIQPARDEFGGASMAVLNAMDMSVQAARAVAHDTAGRISEARTTILFE